MRHPIKLQIKQRRPFGNDWVRFWPVDKILLDNGSIFKTEAQLCLYIYKNFGVGRYQILAWQKKYEGFWLFWLGDIVENGFVRDIKKNKEVEKLKGEFHRAKTFDEKSVIEEEINMEKNFEELTKGGTRRGPLGLKTFRPGQLHHYEEY